MAHKYDHLELGQFIPPQYHFNMLNDTGRMRGFKAALDHVVHPGAKVLELGGGTGVLSFFAARQAAQVWCVERNPDMVEAARSILGKNPNGEKVEVVRADAATYLPPEPVDVVICEMLHVGLLREKQTQIIASFKSRYLDEFGGPLPKFVPEACIQAIQPIQQDFDFEGYYAPTILFQAPTAPHEKTFALANPEVFQMFAYEDEIPQTCGWDGQLEIRRDGHLNALRLTTKNILTMIRSEMRTVDWFNQYLVIPLYEPLRVRAGDAVAIQFEYAAGASFQELMESLLVEKVEDRASAEPAKRVLAVC